MASVDLDLDLDLDVADRPATSSPSAIATATTTAIAYPGDENEDENGDGNGDGAKGSNLDDEDAQDARAKSHGSNGSGGDDDGDGERTKKRRITRACDLCNKRRVKCDGQQPCSRCAGQDVCEYARAVFKRGKPSRSALLERAHHSGGAEVVAADRASRKTGMRSQAAPPRVHRERPHAPADQPRGYGADGRIRPSALRHSSFGADSLPPVVRKSSFDHSLTYEPTMTLEGSLWNAPMQVSRADSLKPTDQFTASAYPMGLRAPLNSAVPAQSMCNGRQFAPSAPAPTMQQAREDHMRIGFLSNNDEAIDTGSDTHSGGLGYSKSFKYPVLKPLMPFIMPILTESQACNLLELYFSSQFNTLHPVCRHVHAFIFRKVSVMSKENPRKCSPALLASMLWAAAETGGTETVVWSHSKRMDVCRRLRTLTIQLLRPLVHIDLGGAPAVGDFGEAREAYSARRTSSEAQLQHFSAGSPHNSGTLDDVVTYIHIAAITSASEEKAMSMRWWHAAFALARELRLNKEPIPRGAESAFPGVSPTANNQSMLEFESDPWFGLNSFNFDSGLAEFMDGRLDSAGNLGNMDDEPGSSFEQEVLEERRRAWWLLYIQDRHLALCYNRQNALLDAECEDLLLPLDEVSYQSGAFLYDPAVTSKRPRFPSFQCTGHNIYGWFLPLMTIVGTILDYNHLKNHHTLGRICSDAQQTQLVEMQILSNLDMYSEGLANFEQANTPSGLEVTAAQELHHTKTVVAYARHVIDVSRVLLAGKWDPVSLFDDKDMFMATPSFTTTIANAISAANHINHILDVDPDLSFVPYFLGIQLLQGSLPLLLIVDRLQTETDPKITDACEAIIRATEACVSTLDTEYQVSAIYPKLTCIYLIPAVAKL